ncbi:hypothetical protein B5C34_02895 [Pacificimonas flava]|uniref:PEP-CTERM protein-sorting domain-containing protein n=2 Tax=Pacificimonas TaxID=1960290 RepID=A0A219B2V1_9SPHN|nr:MULTISPECIES: choice-of-anchor L domain-containing protein [Pacificimonas]MBZ6377832.1 choice-of-anchor L domain-containing protein [Pacificimonas aurantium]OWV32504.1 hypothetical protein B5C34_02895 [Pacificimonas flava]
MDVRGSLLALSVAAALAAPASAISVSGNETALDLASQIAGSGITITGATYDKGASATVQSGTFTGGSDALPFDTGIVLTTGNVAQVTDTAGQNYTETRGDGFSPDDNISTVTGSGGTLAILNSTDYASLEFTFTFTNPTDPSAGNVNFAFAFASEEYIDFIGTGFNDEFQLLINGTNVGTTTGQAGGDTVNINNVNDQVNSSLYVNNVANTNGIPNANLAFGFDGRTAQINAFISGLDPFASHTAQFVVADVFDEQLDSAVFISGGTFSVDAPPTATDVPAPGALGLLGVGLLAMGRLRRR